MATTPGDDQIDTSGKVNPLPTSFPSQLGIATMASYMVCAEAGRKIHVLADPQTHSFIIPSCSCVCSPTLCRKAAAVLLVHDPSSATRMFSL